MIELDKNLKLSDASAEYINNVAKEKGKEFANKVKTHQLRNFYSSIEKMRNQLKILRKLERSKKVMDKTQFTNDAPTVEQKIRELSENIETQLVLLKPKMAYAAGRIKKVRDLFDFVEWAVDSVTKEKDEKKKFKAYQNFFHLMESVVGYHKFFESK